MLNNCWKIFFWFRPSIFLLRVGGIKKGTCLFWPAIDWWQSVDDCFAIFSFFLVSAGAEWSVGKWRRILVIVMDIVLSSFMLSYCFVWNPHQGCEFYRTSESSCPASFFGVQSVHDLWWASRTQCLRHDSRRFRFYFYFWWCFLVSKTTWLQASKENRLRWEP